MTMSVLVKIWKLFFFKQFRQLDIFVLLKSIVQKLSYTF